MSESQKIIKALAIGLAVFIIISLVNGFMHIGAIFIDNDSDEKIEFNENYQEISNLYVDAEVAKITIKEGNEFNVYSENISKKFKVIQKKNTLRVTESSKNFFLKNSKNPGNITITVPEELNSLKINAGIGTVDIDGISAKKFYLEQGAGTVNINNTTFNKNDIDGGAGDIKIINSTLNDLDLEAGIGKVLVEGNISGKSKIDCGVGEISLKLNGNKEDYFLTVEKGIGSIKIDGINYNSNATYGNGENRLKVNGGVGAIDISFK